MEFLAQYCSDSKQHFKEFRHEDKAFIFNCDLRHLEFLQLA